MLYICAIEKERNANVSGDSLVSEVIPFIMKTLLYLRLFFRFRIRGLIENCDMKNQLKSQNTKSLMKAN